MEAGILRREKGLVNKAAVPSICCKGVLSQLVWESEVRNAYFGAWHVDDAGAPNGRKLLEWVFAEGVCAAVVAVLVRGHGNHLPRTWRGVG
jgi:hypothetical protein